MGDFAWYDAVRVLLFFLNCYVLFLLLKRKYDGKYATANVKTLDLWFAQVMWTLAGCVFCVQGILLNRPFTAGFVFLAAATLVGGKAVHNKGPWGIGSA